MSILCYILDTGIKLTVIIRISVRAGSTIQHLHIFSFEQVILTLIDHCKIMLKAFNDCIENLPQRNAPSHYLRKGYRIRSITQELTLINIDARTYYTTLHSMTVHLTL